MREAYSPSVKPWGTTCPVLRKETLHVDEIAIVCGGYCSIHRHARKANLFHVLAGRLWVVEFDRELETVSTHVLEPFDAVTIRAGVWHQFWSPGEALVQEVYHAQALCSVVVHEDIERHAVCPEGGRALTLAELYTRRIAA